MAQYLASLKTGSIEGRPPSKLHRRLGTRSARKPDSPQGNGVSGVRRICAVRASASGEPRREQKNGLDVKRDEAARFQWEWHEGEGPVHNWHHSDTFDGDIAHFTPSTSEVWDCYDSNVTPQPSSGNNGEQTSIEETSSDSNSTMTPEQEFLSIAMKMPQSQFNGIDLMKSRDSKEFNETKEVYVLLFGVGEASTEGIYSLRSHCHETGLHHETIICFESSEDAARFSGLLEASMPHVSTVHTIKSSELIQFCTTSGYDCRLELEGSTLLPPEFNVGITDWERSMKLRQGQFQVLEDEPVYSDPVSEKFPDLQDESSLSDERLQGDINSELDKTRAMLERLLPDDETS